MQNQEDWNNPTSELGGSGKLLPTGEEAQQMPLHADLGEGDDLGAALMDGASLDTGRKGVPGVAVVVGIILVISGGTLWVMRMTGSSAAPADQAVTKAETKINEALKKLAAAGSEGGKLSRGSIEALFQDADQVVSLFANDPVKSQIAVEELRKNPFAMASAAVEEKDAPPDVASQQRQERLRKLQDELARLKLQSVLAGAKSSLAVVNGEVVRKGDTIGSFTVQEVVSGGVKLAADGQSFELVLAPRGLQGK